MALVELIEDETGVRAGKECEPRVDRGIDFGNV
jgi:hypothetical protein